MIHKARNVASMIHNHCKAFALGPKGLNGVRTKNKNGPHRCEPFRELGYNHRNPPAFIEVPGRWPGLLSNSYPFESTIQRTASEHSRHVKDPIWKLTTGLKLKGSRQWRWLEIPGPQTSMDTSSTDGLIFDGESLAVGRIKEDQFYEGIRVRLVCYLEKTRIPLQVDIGFGDAVTPTANSVEYPCLLDAPAPRLNAYPMETVVSEKFLAIASLGMSNSRMKDYYEPD